jgi:SSS family solute:Na+ symporter
VLAIFLLGFFWKRATSTAALLAALLTIPLSALLKFLPKITHGQFPDYPFLDRMSIVFVFLAIAMIVVSLFNKKSKTQARVFEIDKTMFRFSHGFAVGSIFIIGILIALYTVFW